MRWLTLDVIIKNADLKNIIKTAKAIEIYDEQTGNKKQRLTVNWLSRNGCVVYSEGEKDKLTINVRGL